MSFKIKVYISLFIGVLMGLAVGHSWAARNSSGTMSLVSGNPVVTNTPITSTWANTTLSDIANEVTDSLSRSGKGAMSAQFQSVDGTLGSPGISFASETGSGLRRVSAGNVCLTVSGTDSICSTSTGPNAPLPFQGPTTFAGTAANGPVILTPLAAPSAPSNGAIWVETISNKFKVRVNGVTQVMAPSPLARTDLPAVGQQLSSSSGTFNTTSATPVDIMSIAITTTGRPVILIMQPSGATAAQLNMTGGGSQSNIIFDRGGTTIGQWKLIQANPTTTAGESPASLMMIDPVAAGTYTYKVRGNADGTFQLNVLNWTLYAYEL